MEKGQFGRIIQELLNAGIRFEASQGQRVKYRGKKVEHGTFAGVRAARTVFEKKPELKKRRFK